MKKIKIAYLWSLRNAAADKAGQYVDYKGELRYMKSPLEYLVEALNTTPLGNLYSLESVIYDDDELSAIDIHKINEYGFRHQSDRKWFFPPDLHVQGKLLNDFLTAIPSTYRRRPRNAPERSAEKSDFEARLLNKLVSLEAELVVVDGLLVILDELVRPGSQYHRKIINVHPGITCIESPYERRGAYATLDALYGARGLKIINWQTMESKQVPPLMLTGASFHFMDNGIDSGEVVVDVLNTQINPDDTILELRWNNFNNSLFPAMYQGLLFLAQKKATPLNEPSAPTKLDTDETSAISA